MQILQFAPLILYHAQITADAHDLFVVTISSSSSQVLVRAPSSFQSALHAARLLGMLFSGSGSAGHCDFVDLERPLIKDSQRSQHRLCPGAAMPHLAHSVEIPNNTEMT